MREVSAVLESPQKMVLKEFTVPEIGPEAFLLRVEQVSICGGDPIEYMGRNPKVHYPLILGHEMVGEVAQIGERAAARYAVNVGDRVTVEPYIACGHCHYCLTGYYQFCRSNRVYGVTISSDEPPHLWGAYGQYLYGAPGSRVHKVDPGVPASAACLSSVLGNGVRWIRTKAKVQFGEAVCILGAGSQGLVSVIAAKEAGAGAIIVVGKEQNKAKWALAQEFGATHLVDLEQEEPRQAVARILGGELPDVVVETTGVSALIQLGLDLVRPAGRYVVIGTSGYGETSLIMDKVVFKEVQLLGGLGQSLDVEPAVRIINSRRYALEKMITDLFPLEQADAAMRHFIKGGPDVFRVAIAPGA